MKKAIVYLISAEELTEGQEMHKIVTAFFDNCVVLVTPASLPISVTHVFI